MSVEIRNDCCGCTIPCIHCEKEKDYTVAICDWCNKEIVLERVETFRDSDWHTVKVTEDKGQVKEIDICSECHAEFGEGLNRLMGEWDIFKAEHIKSVQALINKKNAEMYIANTDKFFKDMFNSWYAD